MKNLSDVSIAEQKAQKILDAVKKITVEYEPLPLSVSVGVSMFPCCAKNFKDLYSSALSKESITIIFLHPAV